MSVAGTGSAPTQHRLVRLALAEPSAGIVVRALQSESPDGLAHSAIAALRRGECPRPAAQASLDAVLAWRDAWSVWHTATGAHQRLGSRSWGASLRADRATDRARTARNCVAWYGGPLGDLSAGTAALRLRGAYAQSHGLIHADPDEWSTALSTAAVALCFDPGYDAVISPDGSTIGSIVGGPDVAFDDVHLPTEPILPAWAARYGSPGLKRAARRWVTAIAAPIVAAEQPALQEARAAAERYRATTIAEAAGPAATQHILAAADRAEQSGVRIHEHQWKMIDHLRASCSR